MLYAEDMESTKCHLGGVIVRDLSIKVSNYRAHMTLDEYLKEQKVRQNVFAPPGGGGVAESFGGLRHMCAVRLLTIGF